MTAAPPRGRIAAAITEARRLGCGVLVVKGRDGSIDAHADLAVDTGTLEIYVAPEGQASPAEERARSSSP